MKKTVLILVVNLFTQFIFSQNLNNFEKPTPNHILVKGTNIQIIPPKNYSQSTSFKGFQNPDDQTSMIMIVEIPGPFNEVTKGFNIESLTTNGMKLISKNKVVINEFNGIIIDLEQEANGLTYSKNILIYGDEKSTTMINGVFLKEAKEIEKEIKASIRTTIIDKVITANPRETLGYTLDETIGNLVFNNVIGNGFLFNRDGKIPTQSEDKATLITDKSYSKVVIDKSESFCISRLKNYPNKYQVIDEKGINKIEIDGLKGYELYAKNLDLENEILYQVILFLEDGGYYIFIGTYINGNAIEDIRNVIMTFKRKK